MTEMDAPIVRVLRSYESAVLAKDIEAFMRRYDPKVRVFDAWGVWSYEGHEAWRIAVEGWFSSLGQERVKVSFDEVQSSEGHELATLSAMVTYAALNAQGDHGAECGPLVSSRRLHFVEAHLSRAPGPAKKTNLPLRFAKPHGLRMTRPQASKKREPWGRRRMNASCPWPRPLTCRFVVRECTSDGRVHLQSS